MKPEIRIEIDPLDEVVLAIDLHTKTILGGIAYIECFSMLEIIGFWVEKDSQNKGIGTELMQFLIQHFNKTIRLGVLNVNHDAQRFYHRLGFKWLRAIRNGGAHFLIRKQ